MGTNIDHYRELQDAVESNINQRSLHQSARKSITEEVVGTIDGKSSQRVAKFLLSSG